VGAYWCAKAWVKESAAAGATGRHPAGIAVMRSPRGGHGLPRSGQRGARAGKGEGRVGVGRAVALLRARPRGEKTRPLWPAGRKGSGGLLW
jgi:hypothetical protein